MRLHPHFNAIIGGRGSGKSTVFESIRIAMRQDLNLENEAPRLNKTFDQLDAWWPEDKLSIKYTKESFAEKKSVSTSKHFEPLEKSSAGQKAAAILAFLLSYGDEPLMIDQPEDDLANALIYDLIVNQIHINKNRRQLIIVTHNPNIVVNGDAELVHVLAFENGQVHIRHQGGLEESETREVICKLMEGREVAFDKCYRRIRNQCID